MKSRIIMITCLFVCLLGSFGIPHIVLASEEAGHDHALSGQLDQKHSHNAGDQPPVIIQIETGAESLIARKAVEISFLITDRHGKAAKGLTISHERLLHIVIISEDFSSFAHIHPEDFGQITAEMRKDARYPVRYTFPKAGRYLIAVDAAVQEAPVSKQFYVTVEGEPKAGSLSTDLSQKKSVGEYVVSLKSMPEKIRAGEKTALRFEIMRNGEPVKDLEQYLGAPMHLAIVMTDLNSFVHAHGDVPGASHIHAGHIHGAAKTNYGPEIGSEVVFPRKGIYKIFSQVQDHGKVIIFDFMVGVE